MTTLTVFAVQCRNFGKIDVLAGLTVVEESVARLVVHGDAGWTVFVCLHQQSIHLRSHIAMRE